MKEFIERLQNNAEFAEQSGESMTERAWVESQGQLISHNEAMQVVSAFELLQTILKRSNTDYCQSAEDMQNALEAIHEEIRAVFPDLEEAED
jgi:homospermidine synthase